MKDLNGSCRFSELVGTVSVVRVFTDTASYNCSREDLIMLGFQKEVQLEVFVPLGRSSLVYKQLIEYGVPIIVIFRLHAIIFH